MSGSVFERLSATRIWIFDLDETLYPSGSGLFSEIDSRMASYISGALGVSWVAAEGIRRRYLRDHGATLSGLVSRHRIDAEAFLDFAHDVDYSSLRPRPSLAYAARSLPGRKLVFTNGCRRHAFRVLSALGLSDVFEAVFDLRDSEFIAKPNPEAYRRFVSAFGACPEVSAMFEDRVENLREPSRMGMISVLVDESDEGSSSSSSLSALSALPSHVDYRVDDLPRFLRLAVGG